jgi:hypothetical protein
MAAKIQRQIGSTHLEPGSAGTSDIAAGDNSLFSGLFNKL